METWVWEQPEEWYRVFGELPPIPQACVRLHQRACTASSPHAMSAKVPLNSMVLPKVLQASVKLGDVTLEVSVRCCRPHQARIRRLIKQVPGAAGLHQAKRCVLGGGS